MGTQKIGVGDIQDQATRELAEKVRATGSLREAVETSREPINIHPDTRERLRNLLMSNHFMGTGVGYTAFVEAAIDAYGDRPEEFQAKAVERQSFVNKRDYPTPPPPPEPGPGERLEWVKQYDEHCNREYAGQGDAEGLFIQNFGVAKWGLWRRGENYHDLLGPDYPTLALAKLAAEYHLAGGDLGGHLPRTQSRRHPQNIRMRGGSASNTKWVCSCGAEKSGSNLDYKDAVSDGWYHVEGEYRAFINGAQAS